MEDNILRNHLTRIATSPKSQLAHKLVENTSREEHRILRSFECVQIWFLTMRGRQSNSFEIYHFQESYKYEKSASVLAIFLPILIAFEQTQHNWSELGRCRDRACHSSLDLSLWQAIRILNPSKQRTRENLLSWPYLGFKRYIAFGCCQYWLLRLLKPWA